MGGKSREIQQGGGKTKVFYVKQCFGSDSVWIRFISARRIWIGFMKRIRVAENQPKSWKISTKINQEYRKFFQKY